MDADGTFDVPVGGFVSTPGQLVHTVHGRTQEELLETAQKDGRAEERWIALAELSAKLEFTCGYCSAATKEEVKQVLTLALRAAHKLPVECEQALRVRVFARFCCVCVLCGVNAGSVDALEGLEKNDASLILMYIMRMQGQKQYYKVMWYCIVTLVNNNDLVSLRMLMPDIVQHLDHFDCQVFTTMIQNSTLYSYAIASRMFHNANSMPQRKRRINEFPS